MHKIVLFAPYRLIFVAKLRYICMQSPASPGCK